MSVIEVGLVMTACFFGAMLLATVAFDIVQELKNG